MPIVNRPNWDEQVALGCDDFVPFNPAANGPVEWKWVLLGHARGSNTRAGRTAQIFIVHNRVKHAVRRWAVCQSRSDTRDESAALPSQRDNPAPSCDSTAVPSSGRLLGHYGGAPRWRCSCLGAKWTSQVQRGANPGTIHREVTAAASMAALEALIREPQRAPR